MKEIIHQIAERIAQNRERSQVEEIWFYGSRAKGTAKRESDIDILVVEDSDHFSRTLQSRKEKGVSWLDLGDTFESRHLAIEARRFSYIVRDLEVSAGARIDI